MNRYIVSKLLSFQFGGDIKWRTFSHNGVLFPPEYTPHNIPLKYMGNPVSLTNEQEEMAMAYAKYIDSDYVKNKVFNKNFFHDFKKILGPNSPIKSLELCDFSEYKLLIDKNKEKSKSQPQPKPDESKYKTAIIDGKPEPVGNYRIEPPGIFIGRGTNPNLGRIKKRIYPEDIIINIDKNSPIPVPNLNGHKWKQVIHDRHVEWLASWKDTITNKTKYVWLGSGSDMKSSNDIMKFDLARKLKKKIKNIILKNNINLLSDDNVLKQISTCLYLIDKLALRVGNEKSSDETDTVGVTSLRVEHIKLLPNNKIVLDFLGKDSVRYLNTITIDSNVYNNLQEFTKNKQPDDQLFDLVSSSDINKYLQTFMGGLTAKVFRTYNASNIFQKELKKINNKYSETKPDTKTLLDEFAKANIKVALLCNHQKNVGKSFKPQIDRINIQIKKVKSSVGKTSNPDKIKKLKKQILSLKSKKEIKSQMKNISLGTSKANYIDPRITIAFMKKYDIPVDKVFSKALQAKFAWAFNIDENFKF